jgi:hypothetical protein
LPTRRSGGSIATLNMPGPGRLRAADVGCLLSLLGAAVVVAFPIFRGGYLTYIDNSVHLAEIWDLARPGNNGWSEISFCGFPLGTLHSPLFYPLLAWLTRHGVPLEPMYAGALYAGFVAAPLAFYWAARRRTSPVRAAFLAHLLLVQYPMIWGIGSPLGGMWTNALASGFLVVVVELHSRRTLSWRGHVAASAFLAIAVLTHLFVLPLIALFVLVVASVQRTDGPLERRELVLRFSGFVLAAIASAKYWLTYLWVSNDAATPVQTFTPLFTLARLVLPVDPMYLLDNRLRESLHTKLFYTDMIPILGVIVLGIYGFARMRDRQDVLGRSGFLFSVSLLALLLAHHTLPLKFLGPVSWRLVDWVRIGLAFSAIEPVARFPAIGSPRLRALVTTGCGALAIALGAWWRKPLEADLRRPVSEQISEIEPVWKWLHDNAKPEWGRVYVQDTFGWLWAEGGLAQSHVMVLTAHHVGMPQLGTYYGVVPYGLRWTISEFNSLFTAQNPQEDWILEAMEKTNAGVLVTSSVEVTDAVSEMDGLEAIHVAGPFTVFRRKNAENRPIAELTPANHLSSVDFRPGDVRFDLRSDYDRSRLLIRTLYHPFFRLEGIPGAWLRESPEGFLAIDGIPDGVFSVHVWYEPSKVPGALSVFGWILLAAWAASLARAARKSENDAPAAA